MNQNVRHVKRSSPGRGNNVPFRRVFIVAVLIAFGSGNLGATTSALAAAPDQEIVNLQTTYALIYRLPPGPICAGQAYDVPIQVQARSTGSLNGDQVNFQEMLYGVTVAAHSNDPSVASFDPDLGVTGNEELLGPGQEPTQITLTLQAHKIGSTSIYFAAQKSSIFFNARFPAHPIKVVNCKYQVTVTSRWNFTISVAGWTGTTAMAALSTGQMTLNTAGTSLQGTGRVDWTMYSISPGCSQHHTIAVSQAQLEGTPSADDTQVTVKVTYEPATLTSTHCVHPGETGTFAPPSIQASLPANGGSLMVDHSFVLGEENLTGYSTIRITPVAAP